MSILSIPLLCRPSDVLVELRIYFSWYGVARGERKIFSALVVVFTSYEVPYLVTPGRSCNAAARKTTEVLRTETVKGLEVVKSFHSICDSAIKDRHLR